MALAVLESVCSICFTHLLRWCGLGGLDMCVCVCVCQLGINSTLSVVVTLADGRLLAGDG